MANYFSFLRRRSPRSSQHSDGDHLSSLLSHIEFDVVEELEAFRQWHRQADPSRVFAWENGSQENEYHEHNTQDEHSQVDGESLSIHRPSVPPPSTTPLLVTPPSPVLDNPRSSPVTSENHLDDMTSSQSDRQTITPPVADSSPPSSGSGTGGAAPYAPASQANRTKSASIASDGPSWNGNVFPWMAILGLCAASAGIGVAFSWITSPVGELRPQETASTAAGSVIGIPLEELPLIPLSPTESARLRNPEGRGTSLFSRGEIPIPEDFDLGPDPTTISTRESDIAALAAEETPTETEPEVAASEVERVESTNVASATPTTPQIDNLGPDLGAGTYLVLMAYQDDSSLATARQFAGDAFVKQLNGETYIQIAAFDQLEYARHLADDMRNQGLPALVLQ